MPTGRARLAAKRGGCRAMEVTMSLLEVVLGAVAGGLAAPVGGSAPTLGSAPAPGCAPAGGGAAAVGGSAATAAIVQQLAALLAGEASGAPGGLAGLRNAFEQGGLRHIFASWVGTGANLPISPQQLEQVLGSGAIGRLAAASGVNTTQVTGGLAQLLPVIVDRLTPQGQLPTGSGATELASLARQLLAR